MDTNPPPKSVKELLKTFDPNPKPEKKRIPSPKNSNPSTPFPTLKKLPKDISNNFTETKKSISPNQTPKKPTIENININNTTNNNPFLKNTKNNFNTNSFSISTSNKNINNNFQKNLTSNKINPIIPKKKNSSPDINNKLKNDDDTDFKPDAEEDIVPLTYIETELLLQDPKFQKVKQLKEITDNNFKNTLKDQSKRHASIVKSLVSKDKTRFTFDGFDLDLTYITPRIIAMGFPSKSIEGIYRNNMEDVKKFFNTRHFEHYKVYNLCDDRTYPENTFFKQGHFPFKDHEAPPVNLMRPFCEDAKKFLDENEKNVIAVHCLAGKGRTGTFICCLLLYLKFFETAEECLLYYGLMRVGTVKGVTVPSQIRYVHYFETIFKNNLKHPIIFKNIRIRKINMYTCPKVRSKKYTPEFTIENSGKIIKSSDYIKKISYDFNTNLIEFPIAAAGFNVCGDVKFTFYNVQLLKKEKMFKFWFNTTFLPENGIFEIKKEAIDKACKDKHCKVYKDDFKIELGYIFV